MILSYRRENPRIFQEGEYIPLSSSGPKGDHVCAFSRLYQDQGVVAVAPRLIGGLTGGGSAAPVGPEMWGETWVVVPSWKPHSQYRNILTEERFHTTTIHDQQMLPMGEVLRSFPVAVLERFT